MKRLTSLLLTVLCLLSLAPAAQAISVPIPPPPKLEARAWILIDQHSGRVLVAENADERLEPASLTKLMTAYAVFHSLAEGKLKLADSVPISEHAWRAEGSRTFVDVGTRVPIETLLQGMIIQSGNDASIALAEAVAGTEPTFAQLMNGYARQLGMKNTNFMNSNGLPDPKHYVSARDMATLAAAIIREFPAYYRWYSQKEFSWNGITQGNRNGLLYRDPSVDGMKTGHTETAGYCLVSSAQRDGTRLIAVVMGTASPKAREDASLALLNYGFNFFETRRVYAAGTELAKPRVYKSDGGEAAVGVRQDVYVTVPRGEFANIRLSIALKPALTAPIKAAQAVGVVRATLNGKVIAERPLQPLKDVEEGNFFRRLLDTMALWFD